MCVCNILYVFSYTLHMDIYRETNINFLVRLAREAHDPNTDVRKSKLFAKAISVVLDTLENYHVLYYLHTKSCIRTDT